MRKPFLLVLMSLVCFASGKAQHYQKWIFGTGAGLDFSTFPPTPINKSGLQANFPIISSSIADASGQLQFYTDGMAVYNAAGNKLEKYRNRWPWSGFVMPLLIPVQNNDSLYYLFGVSDESYAHKLQYLYLNSKGNGGAGEIVYPQPSTLSNYFVRLLDNCSVQLAATLHCNRKDTWVVSYFRQQLLAFLITTDGVATAPVSSTLPNSVVTQDIYDGGGNMRFSVSGERMAMPLLDENAILVSDFDDLSGKFSNPYRLQLPPGLTIEDIELSPDGTKLYVGARYDNDLSDLGGAYYHSIYQMDLNAGSPSAIEKTWIQVNSFADITGCSPRRCWTTHRALSIGLDGRLYIGMRDDMTTISIIEEPNQPGRNCNYRRNVFQLGVNYLFMGYNYIKTGAVNPKSNGIVARKNNCKGQPVNFSLIYNQVDKVQWDFGEPSSGTRNQSEDLAPSHLYADTGLYTITAIITRRCFTDTATYSLRLTDLEAVSFASDHTDSAICKGQILEIHPQAANASDYLWIDSDKHDPQRTLTKPGTYELLAKNDCSTASYSITMAITECPCDFYLPNAFSPNNDGINEVYKPAGKCAVKEYQLNIYNRYGQQVFASNQAGNGWDGRRNGQALPDGVYVYTMTYKDPNTYKVYRKKGTLLLSR